MTESGARLDPERITTHNALVTHPAWLDERTLIYTVTAEDGSGQSLYTVDVERRIPHRVSSGITERFLSVGVSTTRPRRLILTVATPRASLWTLPIADRVQSEAAIKPVAVPTARALGPRFVDKDLLFLSSKGGGDGLWLLQDNRARELWKGGDGGIVAPAAISPDGREICFSYRKNGRAGLYLMNSNGTNVRTLTDSFDVRGGASWSPNGEWIVVAGNAGEGMRVFKVPVNGGLPIQLLDTLSYHPAWSPDGQMIVYCEQQGGGHFAVKAITPEKVPLRIPDIEVSYTTAIPYRFVPNRKALIYLKTRNLPDQDFYFVDLENGKERKLSGLKPGSLIQSFDISSDGKEIVFDRVRQNADIVIMDLAR
jgi:dipeptidyl aminopeptidase/acylaminoacyl peptidase